MSNVKYAVGYLKQTANLGDDIWAYAAMKLLPRYDYIIDYRNINNFRSYNGEKVAILLSGFPITRDSLFGQFIPSMNLIPKFVGVHFREYSYDWLSQPLLKRYLCAYSPIGARDFYTAKNLLDIGINSYFAGCLTLTLNPPHTKNRKRSRKVIVVDCSDVVIEKVKTECIKLELDMIVKTHVVDWDTYKYKAWDNRISIVEEYLDEYATAHCVITSRLHVGLPCLAFGTPTLLLKPPFVKDDETSRRFIPFLDYFHFGLIDDFLSDKID